jgi:hypothetical protein
MALIAHFAPKGMDEKKYAEVLRRLERAGAGAPLGRLYHAAYGDRSGLRVVDVYDTPQNFEAFGRILGPILAELGIEVGPPEAVEVHNIIRG